MTMPAGVYYIGDLCYILHPHWKEMCELTIKDGDCLEGEFTLSNGVRFAMYRTKWGDGEFDDQHGNHYPVDSGSIGCVLVKDVMDDEDAWLEGVHPHTFTQDFTTGSNKDYLQFGHICIDVSGEEEDDELGEEGPDREFWDMS